MKLKNVVEGTRIQAKRDVTGYGWEVIPKGSEVTVGMVQNPPKDNYPVRIDHEDISEGYAWVNPADFRKVKEVTVEEPAEETTEYTYSVGDKVLVGSEGAGFGYVDPDLANKVCTVTEVHPDGTLRVFYPEVTPTQGYTTYPRYVSPYVEPEPVQEFQEGTTVRITRTHEARHYEQVQAGDICEVLHKFLFAPDMYTLAHPNGVFGTVTIHQDDLELVEEPVAVNTPEINPQVGDWVVANAVDPNLVAGVAYQVVGFSDFTGRAGIALHTHTEPAWQEVYYTNKADYSKVLREVKPDADIFT